MIIPKGSKLDIKMRLLFKAGIMYTLTRGPGAGFTLSFKPSCCKINLYYDKHGAIAENGYKVD